MDYLSIIFEDPSRIRTLIGQGYKVVMMGSCLRRLETIDLGVCSANVGWGSLRLYFVFSDSDRADPADKITCIDVDLNEFKSDPPHIAMIPNWRKIRAGVRYPFECYIYYPDRGTFYSPSPHIHTNMVTDIVNDILNQRTVSYVLLHIDGSCTASARVIAGYPGSAVRQMNVARSDPISDDSMNTNMMALLIYEGHKDINHALIPM